MLNSLNSRLDISKSEGYGQVMSRPSLLYQKSLKYIKHCPFLSSDHALLGNRPVTKPLQSPGDSVTST